MFVQIPNFEDYMVNDSGIVVSTKRGLWLTLKPQDNGNGYWVVNLYKNGKRYPRKVHRLVASAFLGQSDLDINHKNGVGKDNRLTNLEYATRSENIKHAWDIGLREHARHVARASCVGEKNRFAKLSDAAAADLLLLKGTMLQREAAAMFGISQAQVSKIWNRPSKEQ